jgi:hypothetical protein
MVTGEPGHCDRDGDRSPSSEQLRATVTDGWPGPGRRAAAGPSGRAPGPTGTQQAARTRMGRGRTTGNRLAHAGAVIMTARVPLPGNLRVSRGCRHGVVPSPAAAGRPGGGGGNAGKASRSDRPGPADRDSGCSESPGPPARSGGSGPYRILLVTTARLPGCQGARPPGRGRDSDSARLRLRVGSVRHLRLARSEAARPTCPAVTVVKPAARRLAPSHCQAQAGPALTRSRSPPRPGLARLRSGSEQAASL